MKLPDVSLQPITIVPDRRTHGANESWVKWLAQNRGGYDTAPEMLATYIKNFGMEGVANARDFVEQWDAQKPGDGTIAIRAILAHLPDDTTRRAFVGGNLPSGPPIGTLKREAVPELPEAGDEPLVERNWIYNPETGMARLADDQPQAIQVAQARTTMSDAVNDGLLQGNEARDDQPQQVAQATPPNSSNRNILPPTAPLSNSPVPIGADYPLAVPPLPADKQNLLGGAAGRERLKVYEGALAALPDKGGNEAAVYRDLYISEGGEWINASNRATTGFTVSEARAMIDNGMVPGIAPGTKPEDIPTDRKPEMQRVYYDRHLPFAGGHKAIGAIEDAQTATAFGTTIFMHGGVEGSKAIQRAIVQATGEPSDPVKQKEYIDGKMGRTTLGDLNKVVADPEKKAAFLNALADNRIAMIEALRTRRNEKVEPGEITNINRHRPK